MRIVVQISSLGFGTNLHTPDRGLGEKILPALGQKAECGPRAGFFSFIPRSGVKCDLSDDK